VPVSEVLGFRSAQANLGGWEELIGPDFPRAVHQAHGLRPLPTSACMIGISIVNRLEGRPL